MKRNLKVTFQFDLTKQQVNKYVLACKDQIIKLQQDEISRLKNILKKIKTELQGKLNWVHENNFDAIDANPLEDKLSETLKTISDFEINLEEEENE